MNILLRLTARAAAQASLLSTEKSVLWPLVNSKQLCFQLSRVLIENNSSHDALWNSSNEELSKQKQQYHRLLKSVMKFTSSRKLIKVESLKSQSNRQFKMNYYEENSQFSFLILFHFFIKITSIVNYVCLFISSRHLSAEPTRYLVIVREHLIKWRLLLQRHTLYTFKMLWL